MAPAAGRQSQTSLPRCGATSPRARQVRLRRRAHRRKAPICQNLGQSVTNVKKRSRAKAPLLPAEIVRRLSKLYGEPVWRPHGDPMTELALTILSQNTSDANSGRAFMRLVHRFPDWRALM